MKTKPRPSRLRSVLASPAFSGLGIEAKLREYKVRKAWEGAVGKNLAGKASPIRLIGKTLHCSAISSPWMSELSYHKPSIIAKINKALGEEAVTEIVFKIGPAHGAAGAVAERPSEGRLLTEEEKAFIEKAIRPVKDSSLRSLISRAIEKSKTGR